MPRAWSRRGSRPRAELTVHPHEGVEHRGLVVEAADRGLGGGHDPAGLVLIETDTAHDGGRHLEPDPVAAPCHVDRSSNASGGRTPAGSAASAVTASANDAGGFGDLELDAVDRVERASRHEAGQVDRSEPERRVARRIGELHHESRWDLGGEVRRRVAFASRGRDRADPDGRAVGRDAHDPGPHVVGVRSVGPPVRRRDVVEARPRRRS